jgi:hypothetical protein
VNGWIRNIQGVTYNQGQRRNVICQNMEQYKDGKGVTLCVSNLKCWHFYARKGVTAQHSQHRKQRKVTAMLH